MAIMISATTVRAAKPKPTPTAIPITTLPDACDCKATLETLMSVGGVDSDVVGSGVPSPSIMIVGDTI